MSFHGYPYWPRYTYWPLTCVSMESWSALIISCSTKSRCLLRQRWVQNSSMDDRSGPERVTLGHTSQSTEQGHTHTIHCTWIDQRTDPRKAQGNRNSIQTGKVLGEPGGLSQSIAVYWLQIDSYHDEQLNSSISRDLSIFLLLHNDIGPDIKDIVLSLGWSVWVSGAPTTLRYHSLLPSPFGPRITVSSAGCLYITSSTRGPCIRVVPFIHMLPVLAGTFPGDFCICIVICALRPRVPEIMIAPLGMPPVHSSLSHTYITPVTNIQPQPLLTTSFLSQFFSKYAQCHDKTRRVLAPMCGFYGVLIVTLVWFSVASWQLREESGQLQNRAAVG